MAFVDECTVFADRRARRERLGVAALRALQAPRRPRRRQRGRRWLDRVRGLPRRARPVVARRPSPPEGAGRRSRAEAPSATGASGKDLVVPVPDGTVVFDDRRPDRRPGGRGHARRGGRRAAAGAAGNAAFASARNRVPAHRRARARTGRSARSRWSSARWPTSAWWGCRTRASPRCWLASPPPNPRSRTIPFTTLTPNLGVAGEDDGPVRGGRHPGPGGGRQRGQGAGAPVPAAHRAMPGARAGGRPGGGGSRRPTWRPSSPSWRPTTPSWHGARRSWWARRPTWSMTPPRAIARAGSGGARRSRR